MTLLENLQIEATPKSPFILFNGNSGLIEIYGRSIPIEGAKEFYKPIIEWVNKYIQNPNSSTIVKIKLEYFNTRSIDAIITILKAIEGIGESNTTQFFWYLDNDDEDGMEAVDDINSVLKTIKIQVLPV